MIYYKILYWTSILPLADVVVTMSANNWCPCTAVDKEDSIHEVVQEHFMIYSMILHWTRTLPSHSGTRLESSDSSS